jgi:hypothetical protein
LLIWEPLKGFFHFPEVYVAILGGMHAEPFGKHTIAIADLAPCLAVLRIEVVAQDGEHPCLEMRARLERILFGPRFYKRFLHKIIRLVTRATQRKRERSQARYDIYQIFAKCHVSDVCPVWIYWCPNLPILVPVLRSGP